MSSAEQLAIFLQIACSGEHNRDMQERLGLQSLNQNIVAVGIPDSAVPDVVLDPSLGGIDVPYKHQAEREGQHDRSAKGQEC